MAAPNLVTLFNFRAQLINGFAALLTTAGLPGVVKRYDAGREESPEITVDARVGPNTKRQGFIPAGAASAGQQCMPHYHATILILVRAERLPDSEDVALMTLESQVRTAMAFIGGTAAAPFPGLTLDYISLRWLLEGPGLDASEMLFGAKQVGGTGFKDDLQLLQWDCEFFIRDDAWPAP